MQWSALEIISQAAAELGLVVPDALPSDSVQDRQMLSMLNAAGIELVSTFPWSFLSKEWTLHTTPGTLKYSLPDDYAYMLNMTEKSEPWSFGPASEQQWQHLHIGSISNAYRIVGGELIFKVDPGESDMSLFYISSAWVQRVNGNVDRVAVAGDKPLYDPILLVKFIKVRFLSIKGLDSALAQSELKSSLWLSMQRDRPARIVSLTGHKAFPYLSYRQLPEGSWGQ